MYRILPQSDPHFGVSNSTNNQDDRLINDKTNYERKITKDSLWRYDATMKIKMK